MLTKIQVKQLPYGFNPIQKTNFRRNQTARFQRSEYIPYSPAKMIFSERKINDTQKKKSRRTNFLQRLGRKIQRFFSKKTNKTMGTRLGKLIKVKNKKKVSHLASEFYHSTWIRLHDGRVVPVLFTENEIEDALERAGRNPEDIVGRSLTSLILD